MTRLVMSVLDTNVYDAALTGGATLQFVVPNSVVEVAPEKLPHFDVSGLPGARISLRRGFLSEGGSNVHVACVEAPSDRWAPRMEEVVFGVANGVAHRAMTERLPIDRWEAGAIIWQDERFEQKLYGKTKPDSSPVKLLGKHVLGFEGAQREVVLCSVLCDEPRDHEGCADIVAQANLGGLVAPPPPSLLVQAVFFAAERPFDAAGMLGIAGLLVVGIILARRPRPMP